VRRSTFSFAYKSSISSSKKSVLGANSERESSDESVRISLRSMKRFALIQLRVGGSVPRESTRSIKLARYRGAWSRFRMPSLRHRNARGAALISRVETRSIYFHAYRASFLFFHSRNVTRADVSCSLTVPLPRDIPIRDYETSFRRRIKRNLRSSPFVCRTDVCQVIFYDSPNKSNNKDDRDTRLRSAVQRAIFTFDELSVTRHDISIGRMKTDNLK